MFDVHVEDDEEGNDDEAAVNDDNAAGGLEGILPESRDYGNLWGPDSLQTTTPGGN